MSYQVDISNRLAQRIEQVRCGESFQDFVERAVTNAVRALERDAEAVFAADRILAEIRVRGPLASTQVIELLTSGPEGARFAPSGTHVVSNLRQAFRDMGGSITGYEPGALWSCALPPH